MSHQPVGIVLAAGNSRRFGSNKLLYPVIDDTPMLLVSAQKMASVLPNSIVVITERLKEYQGQLQQLGLQVVINKDADRGMASSIVCGINHSADASGWLISLADMPFIRQQTLSLLADRLKTGVSIVAPEYNEQRGHPVGFNKVYKDELLALNGDVGARAVINKYQDKLVTLPVDDRGVIQDIDYPDDV